LLPPAVKYSAMVVEACVKAPSALAAGLVGVVDDDSDMSVAPMRDKEAEAVACACCQWKAGRSGADWYGDVDGGGDGHDAGTAKVM